MFDKQTAFITGGSSGIGLALARHLRKRGANVVIVSRSGVRLKAACADLAKTTAPGEILSFRGDVRNYLEIRNIVRATEKQHPINLLVNSAGMVQPLAFEQTNLAIFKRTMAANFLGTVNTIKSALPFLLERKAGYIVNVGSMAGFIGVFGYTAYSASKFAVHGFTQSLRAELKPRGIHVLLIAPPDTDTPMLARERAHMPPETAGINDAGGMLTADEVALAIIAGVENRRNLVVPGFEGKFAYYASRFIPRVVDFVMDRKIAGVQRSQ